MRKIIALLLLVTLISCEKEEVNELEGTWDITHMKGEDGSYFSITDPLVIDFYTKTYVSFNNDYSYRLKGWFGDLNGKYKREGADILLYENNSLIAKCQLLSINEGHAEATITILETMYKQSIKLKRR